MKKAPKLPIEEYFSQLDPQWSNKKIGDATVATDGCGAMTLAMSITHLHPNRYVSPEETLTLISENGWHHSSFGTSWKAIENIPKIYGLKIRPCPKNFAKIRAELSNGGLVIAAMGPGHFTQAGHFIIIASSNVDKGLRVIDPNDEKPSNPKYLKKSNATWQWSIIKAEALALWTIVE